MQVPNAFVHIKHTADKQTARQQSALSVTFAWRHFIRGIINNWDYLKHSNFMDFLQGSNNFSRFTECKDTWNGHWQFRKLFSMFCSYSSRSDGELELVHTSIPAVLQINKLYSLDEEDGLTLLLKLSCSHLKRIPHWYCRILQLETWLIVVLGCDGG